MSTVMNLRGTWLAIEVVETEDAADPPADLTVQGRRLFLGRIVCVQPLSRAPMALPQPALEPRLRRRRWIAAGASGCWWWSTT